MGLTTKQRETKELAIAILESLGKDYEAEMTAWHNQIISENQKIILNSLRASKEKNNKPQGGNNNGGTN
ncbi:hypothetical protein [Enterococcus termitis]|uniref:Uncharacterized protein n=1 Tax=Enterococcus termitis TaxID=332950 RepID=A0A1E5H1C1_9ENTE|nr:hypothetical protein [Enterococcus termitis]OEG18703.1 hypothetical protein BCR25_16010 [Enterococcus termitis]